MKDYVLLYVMMFMIGLETVMVSCIGSSFTSGHRHNVAGRKIRFSTDFRPSSLFSLGAYQVPFPILYNPLFLKHLGRLCKNAPYNAVNLLEVCLVQKTEMFCLFEWKAEKSKCKAVCCP